MNLSRYKMRKDVSGCADPGDLFAAVSVSAAHAPQLAALMEAAYRGTIDDKSETPAQYLEEIQATIDGKYGPFLAEASFVLLEDAIATAACLVTFWQERPLLAYCVTRPVYQGRGRARFLIQKSLAALQSSGHKTLDLVVTVGNTSAEALYKKLGFTLLEYKKL